MAAMSERATVTNEQVAKDLGISHSMVSRIRSSDRHPSVPLMSAINRVYGWSFNAQMRVYGEPAYAATFEKILNEHYASAAS